MNDSHPIVNPESDSELLGYFRNVSTSFRTSSPAEFPCPLLLTPWTDGVVSEYATLGPIFPNPSSWKQLARLTRLRCWDRFWVRSQRQFHSCSARRSTVRHEPITARLHVKRTRKGGQRADSLTPFAYCTVRVILAECIVLPDVPVTTTVAAPRCVPFMPLLALPPPHPLTKAANPAIRRSTIPPARVHRVPLGARATFCAVANTRPKKPRVDRGSSTANLPPPVMFGDPAM